MQWVMKHSPCEKPGALNVFSDVVMKVLMFTELVSGVKYPKITTVGPFLSDRLWMFCHRAVLFF